MRWMAPVAASLVVLSAPALAEKPEQLKPGQVRVVGKYKTKKLKFGDKRSTFYLVKKGSELRMRARGPISMGIEIRGLEYSEVGFKLGLDGEMEGKAQLDLSPVEVRRLYFHIPDGTHWVTVVAQKTTLIHPIKVYHEAFDHETLVAWQEVEQKKEPPPAPPPIPGGWEEVEVEEGVPQPPASVAKKIEEEQLGSMPTPEFSLTRGKRTSFAVMDLVAEDFEQHVADTLTQSLLSEIKGLEDTLVLNRNELMTRLPENEEQTVAACKDSDMCLAELGRILKVDRLVLGQVNKLPESYVVSLRLLDPAEARVDAKISESFRGEDDQLVRAVRHAGRRLLGLGEEGSGSLAVSASEPDATVFLDNQNRGKLPMPPLHHVPAGRHLVRVTKGGFSDWQTDVYVNPEETTAVWADLKYTGKKWYQHWWVWTVAGVVLAGGGVTTYLLVR